MNDISPIRNESDYDEAIGAYFVNEPELGTPDADRFDLLALSLSQITSDGTGRLRRLTRLTCYARRWRSKA